MSATAFTCLGRSKEKQTTTKFLLEWVYYKLQVKDQLKTGELLLSDLPTYTTFTMHRPFVSTWVLPRMLDKTSEWLCSGYVSGYASHVTWWLYWSPDVAVQVT